MNKFTKKASLLGVLCINLAALSISGSVFSAELVQKASDDQFHIVAAGESLFSIAEKYHLTIANLKQWNNLTDENNLVVGQKLSLNSSINADNPLLVDAKKALTDKKYALATNLLTRLYQQGNEQEKQFALEFLGVAREKKGQKAFAKQAYQRYLTEFPKGENAARVKIRLNNLIGIERIAKNNTLKQGRKKAKMANSYTRGSLSTDYRRSMLVNNAGDSRDTLSLANVDVDAKGNYVQQDYDLGFRVSVGHYQDLLPNSDRTNEQIRYLNFSAKSHDELYQMSFGRQRSRGNRSPPDRPRP